MTKINYTKTRLVIFVGVFFLLLKWITCPIWGPFYLIGRLYVYLGGKFAVKESKEDSW